MNFVQVVILFSLACAGLARDQNALGLSVRQSTCQKKIKVDISIVGDDGVILYICGKNVRQTSQFDEIQTFTYEDVCDDFMLEVNNIALSSGVALLATFNGQKYGTTSSDLKYRVSGTVPLFANATYQPQGNWRSNPPGYDFSNWEPAVVVSTILGIGQNLDFLASQGAFPINVQNGNAPVGIYGLKLFVPFCD